MGVKRPGREVYHSPPTSAEVKNGWSYTSLLPVCLHGVDRNSLKFFCTLFRELLRLFILLAFMSGLYIMFHILYNIWCYIAALLNEPALHLCNCCVLDQSKL
jgi:hypothetical protein